MTFHRPNVLEFFFLRALESIFISVVSALEAEMVFIRNLVGGLLAELEDDINHDKFKRLLHYSRRLTSFQNRVKLVRTVSTPFPAPPQTASINEHSIRFRPRLRKYWSRVSQLCYDPHLDQQDHRFLTVCK
jgi:hypothetical protein